MNEVQSLLFHELAKKEDISKFIKYLNAEKVTAPFPERESYSSLDLALIGSIFSINVRPAAWLNVVESYERKQTNANQTERPLSVLQDNLVRLNSERNLTDYFGNRQRTSANGGITKAEAVKKFCQELVTENIREKRDLKPQNILRVFRRIRDIPGQGSGITLTFFLMLAGLHDFVKPDRRIQRVVSIALGRTIRPGLAAEIVREAALKLEVHPSSLDLALWPRGGR